MTEIQFKLKNTDTINNYYEKYLKYKYKYLQLKNKQFGGDKPLIENINSINLFTDEQMEKFLNPIYGLIMCESGYILNNFYLYQNKLTDTNESKFIFKISKEIPNSVQPTNDIMKLKPIDFGRYIAIKYIFDNNKNFFIITEKNKIIFPNTDPKINKNDSEILIKYINKLRKYFPFEKKEPIYYHIFLYCFWWVANNDTGIVEYYNGINEIFCIVNKYFLKKYSYIDTNKKPQQTNSFDSFERIIFSITTEQFKIYNQEWSKNFCTESKTNKNTYPDCGESTLRNFVNLLCVNVNGNKFDIDLLKKFNGIKELKEYYTVFNNFTVQSDPNKLEYIYGENLNARDAWSKLIISFANDNVIFLRTCKEKSNHYNHFELNAGLAQDRKTSNFFQIIKNLLPGINEWTDIKTDTINNIEDKTIKGVGEILINHNKYGNIIIHCHPGHYYMKLEPINNKINYNHLNPKQKEIIEILLNKESSISIGNYLWIKFDSNLLVQMFYNNITSSDLKMKLLELSMMEQYDSDVRRRIDVDVDVNEKFLDILSEKYENNEIINEYTYLCKDFNFVKKIPKLSHLNCKLKDNKITSIDLSPLSNVKSIGDYFMEGCTDLTSIDLSELSKVESIGYNFMNDCPKLTSIDLSPLSNVIEIKSSFMNRCTGLTSIDLSGLSKVESIGYNFMNDCPKLEQIDLSPLSNVKSIGDDFMNKCTGLTSIDLSGLSNITSIGYNFMNECTGLTSIDLSGLSKVESIGQNFMNGCTNLKQIDLSPLSNVKSIGDDFMNKCTGLTSIDLSGLSNVKSIRHNFMNGCTGLTSIDLSGLSNVKSIGQNFIKFRNYNLIIKCTLEQQLMLKINNNETYNIVLIKN